MISAKVWVKTKRLLSVLFLLIGVIFIYKLFGFSIEGKNENKKYEDYFQDSYKIFSVEIPQELSFAGEKITTDRFDIKESLDREILTNVYWQSNTLLMLKRANRWFPRIEPILKRNNIPDDFKYLALIESSFIYTVSSAGASGFWQFMKKTAQSHGLEINDEVDERYNLEKSTEAACNYLKQAYDTLKNWTLAAASYNMGVGGLKNQVELQKTSNFYDLCLNLETSRYIYRILAMKLIYENPKKYGFLLRKKDMYPEIEVRKLKVDTPVYNLITFAANQNTNYKILKIFNPWLKKPYLLNKLRKTYFIEIPEKINYSDLIKNIPEEDLKFIEDAGDTCKKIN
ncbi:MAG: lytic transglycosylase domain-containing protein [Bacteroidales bacterium]|nr:lytic transglycosylase domain-containing protein [Bacteroidales bacterium]